MHTGLDDVLARNGEPPWSETLILDDRIRATLICHGPGMTNNAHWHPGFSELWAILKGELTWDVGKDRPLIPRQRGGRRVRSQGDAAPHHNRGGSDLATAGDWLGRVRAHLQR